LIKKIAISTRLSLFSSFISLLIVSFAFQFSDFNLLSFSAITCLFRDPFKTVLVFLVYAID